MSQVVNKLVWLWDDESVIRGIFRVRTLQTLPTRKIPPITLASQHAATISLDSSLRRAERHLSKMKTTITFPICNLFHLWYHATHQVLYVCLVFRLSVGKKGRPLNWTEPFLQKADRILQKVCGWWWWVELYLSPPCLPHLATGRGSDELTDSSTVVGT
jgi:hypothetical protein